jgi:hypothetical protein
MENGNRRYDVAFNNSQIRRATLDIFSISISQMADNLCMKYIHMYKVLSITLLCSCCAYLLSTILLGSKLICNIQLGIRNNLHQNTRIFLINFSDAFTQPLVSIQGSSRKGQFTDIKNALTHVLTTLSEPFTNF